MTGMGTGTCTLDRRDWKSVIFSDESKFNLFGSDGRRWCWRKPGEEFDEIYVRNEVKHGGGNVMVWGCVTAMGMGRIVKIDSNMDGPLYTEILKDRSEEHTSELQSQ